MPPADLSRRPYSHATVTVRVPIRFRTRGGRKVIEAPSEGVAVTTQPRLPRVQTSLVKAVARAFRWKRQIDEGSYATLQEISAAEKINSAYISRVFRLTLLAPVVVEAILNGTQAEDLELDHLLVDFSDDWAEQEASFLLSQTNRKRRR